MAMTSNYQRCLVAYFSREGENYLHNNIEVITKGNTAVVAEQLADKLGCSLLEITPVNAYPSSYYLCLNQAKRETGSDYWPEIKQPFKFSNDYDFIFLCFPIWWGSCPRPVFTFLKENDFSGKTIILCCTHEGSVWGSCLDDVQQAVPYSEIKTGFAVKGHFAQERTNEIDIIITDFLKTNNFIDEGDKYCE